MLTNRTSDPLITVLVLRLLGPEMPPDGVTVI